ncbi:MAG: hypothetical protein ABIA47_01640 [bacterium]
MRFIMIALFAIFSLIGAPASAASSQMNSRTASDADLRSKQNQTRSYANKVGIAWNSAKVAQLKRETASLRRQIDNACDGAAGRRDECRPGLRQEITRLDREVSQIDVKVQANSARLTELEGKLNTIAGRVDTLQSEMTKLEKRVKKLESRHTYGMLGAGLYMELKPEIPGIAPVAGVGGSLVAGIGGENAFNGYALILTGNMFSPRSYGGDGTMYFYRKGRGSYKGSAFGLGLGFGGQSYGSIGTPGVDAYSLGVHIGGMARKRLPFGKIDAMLLTGPTIGQVCTIDDAARNLVWTNQLVFTRRMKI